MSAMGRKRTLPKGFIADTMQHRSALSPIRMKHRAAVALCAWLCLSSASAALSCTPAPNWPQEAEVVAPLAAKAMAQEATFIDEVVAERMTNDPDEFGTRRLARMRAGHGLEGWRSADDWWRYVSEVPFRDGVRIHFQVLRRLKGNSAPSFTLNGSKPVVLPNGSKPISTETRLNDLQFFLERKDLIDGPEGCTQPVSARVGERYLIFRNADGLPLETKVPVRFQGGVVPQEGPAVVPILSVDDPWPKLVIEALNTHR